MVAPVAPLGVADLHSSAVIGGEHELNRVVFRYVDEADHVNHEVIACAVAEYFVVVVAVDVVLDLRPAKRVRRCRADRRYLIDRFVVRGCDAWLCVSANERRPERQDDCR